MPSIRIKRHVIVFDASDVAAESAFWAAMLGGRVLAEEGWHNVVDAEDRWVMAVQHAPNHVPPDWPNGNAQQVHLDFHVDDFAEAHREAIALGARLLQAAEDATAEEGNQVYADPAGHPF